MKSENETNLVAVLSVKSVNTPKEEFETFNGQSLCRDECKTRIARILINYDVNLVWRPEYTEENICFQGRRRNIRAGAEEGRRKYAVFPRVLLGNHSFSARRPEKKKSVYKKIRQWKIKASKNVRAWGNYLLSFCTRQTTLFSACSTFLILTVVGSCGKKIRQEKSI